jgi:membrane protease YdiL (CAAX protease family)
MHWDFALIFLFLGIAVPLLGRRRVHQLMQIPATSKEDRLALYATTMAFQWIASGIILWRSAAHGLGAWQLGLGLPRPVATLAVALGLTALVLLNQIVGLKKLAARPDASQGIVPQLAEKLFPQDNAERLAFFALVVTVAVCEEFIYRGFVQRVFQNLSGGRAYVAVIGSAALFALAHLYQGRRGLVSTFMVGLLFSTVTAITLSLMPSIAAHFAADLMAGLLAPKYLAAGRALASTPQ